MENLRIYENICKEEVLNGVQLQKHHSEYSIGKELFAASDIGKFKVNQEDSTIIMVHPNYHDIKLIAVADGLGGHGDGDLASKHIITTVANWFESEIKIKHMNTIELKDRLDKVIKLSIYGLEASPYAGTTLSLALIGNNKTIIANVGDSRVYTYTNDNLKQETIDDSYVEEMYQEEVIPHRELMRFHHQSNMLTQAITKRQFGLTPRFKLINSNYDCIIAASDGVTDCLSKEDLRNIIKNSKDSNIAKNIVQKALTTNSFLIDTIKDLTPEERQTVYKIKEVIKEDYFKKIIGGKDNATAAVYVRKHE